MTESTNESLALRVQSGDTDAIAPLWEGVKRFAYQLTFRFFDRSRKACASSGVTLEDLQQEAFLAVLDAAGDYKEDKEYKFTSYLYYHLKNHFMTAIGMRTNAKKPLNCSDSLDKPLPGVEDLTLSDSIQDPAADQSFEIVENAEYIKELHGALQKSLDVLEQREREVITEKYYDGLTLAQIGEMHGIVGSRARQIQGRALSHMRTKGRKYLLSFIPDYSRAYAGTGFSAWEWRGSIEERLMERAKIRL
ncbi:sigma-70 family RNA polymerase sigma factor [Caproicibacterium sp. BJN0003]|uniref:sigma-70 family RNA polymerase sigma factor n=1 Tax=Caproicibacterium sp. BJN0003 TaxID=2994078 RepID=UPI002252DEB6|nr:sigma-70 family RNA polymerase sigma factor [Caproicibacterium sp. BJN0003]UZT81264.1 sigma-70 family RNA polymerase sigma factor [Caproicibacterium sp. BJN0003]